MMTPRLISALAMATAVFAASTDLSLDRVRTDNVQGENNANSGWADSYSVVRRPPAREGFGKQNTRSF